MNNQSDDYEVVESYEDEHSRRELRRAPDLLSMVYMRRRVGGGWYVKDSIELPLSGSHVHDPKEGQTP